MSILVFRKYEIICDECGIWREGSFDTDAQLEVIIDSWLADGWLESDDGHICDRCCAVRK